MSGMASLTSDTEVSCDSTGEGPLPSAWVTAQNLPLQPANLYTCAICHALLVAHSCGLQSDLAESIYGTWRGKAVVWPCQWANLIGGNISVRPDVFM